MTRDESSFPRAVPVPPWSETTHGQSRRERIPHGALQPRIPERSGGHGSHQLRCHPLQQPLYRSLTINKHFDLLANRIWSGLLKPFESRYLRASCHAVGSVPSIPHGPAAAMMTPQTGVVGGGGYFVLLQAAKRAMAHHSSISGLAKEPLSGHHKAPQARLQWTW